MIVIKRADEIQRMREAGRVVARVLATLGEHIRPGVTTAELEALAEEVIRAAGGRPSFKGYRGFPASICTSVNDEVVHGIPGPRRLALGDIVSVDVGVFLDGYHSDGAYTFVVGEADEGARRLLEVTEAALWAGIEQARAGNRVSDIGHAIQKVVEAAGFSVVREFVGHGIGRSMHEDPQVPNYGEPGRGPRLRPGMTLAIEPMVNEGGPEVRIREDRWTAVTADGSRSAHFEHTVAIGENGPVLLSVP